MRHSTKSYSNDLRERVVAARRSGMSVDDVSATFQVSKDCVYRWVKRHKMSGSAAPKQRGGYKKPKIADMEKFEAFAKAHAHSTLARMRDQWEEDVSLMCLSRTLKRMGWTHKKNKPTTANVTRSSAKPSTRRSR
jgi:transposase